MRGRSEPEASAGRLGPVDRAKTSQRPRSAQAEEPENRHDHYDQPDQVDDVVHVVPPRRRGTQRTCHGVNAFGAAVPGCSSCPWRNRPVESTGGGKNYLDPGGAEGDGAAVVGILAFSFFRLAPYALPHAFAIAIFAATMTCLLVGQLPRLHSAPGRQNLTASRAPAQDRS
jgi:hypothetical protein